MIKAKDCNVRSGSRLPSAWAITIACHRVDYSIGAVGLSHERRA